MKNNNDRYKLDFRSKIFFGILLIMHNALALIFTQWEYIYSGVWYVLIAMIFAVCGIFVFSTLLLSIFTSYTWSDKFVSMTNAMVKFMICFDLVHLFILIYKYAIVEFNMTSY